MTSIKEVGKVLQTLMSKSADELGRSSGFIQRERKLKGSSYAQALVFGWMSNPASSMSELAQVAASMGVQISKQGLDQRFSARSAAFMPALLHNALGQLIQGEAWRAGVFASFAEVHVQDSTSISLPATLREVWRGCNPTGTGSAGLKISVDWELVRGSITGLQLQAASEHDQRAPLAQQLPAKRSLRLRDLGYFNLRTFTQQAQTGSYFLSRLKASAKLYMPDGQPLDWAKYLLECAQDEVDLQVLVGAQGLPCRLLAWRVPADVAQQRQTQLQAKAQDHRRAVSSLRWQTAHWSVYITNAPPELLSLRQAQVLVKVRWQVELLFKVWKSDGLLDEWRTTDPWRALTECFAKLLALLIQHWCILLGAWHVPARSLHQAILLLRKHALHLACALSRWSQLKRVLALLQTALATCTMSTLRRHPHTFQLLERGHLA